MDEFKLMTMTDFTLKCFDDYRLGKISIDDYLFQTYSYSKFLKQPLSKNMFILCDELGNLIDVTNNTCQYDFEVSEHAKNNILFIVDFKMDEESAEYFVSTFETIDNLSQLYDFKLTQNAVSQINIKS